MVDEVLRSGMPDGPLPTQGLSAILALGREDAKQLGTGHRLALVGDIQFAVDMVGMLLHCAGGDEQAG